ncbi:MAG: leucine-rich repeat protein, partial [Ureaplasma sp.]|nr:leucine-rich repeat protein [Ureaplasma sp.]
FVLLELLITLIKNRVDLKIIKVDNKNSCLFINDIPIYCYQWTKEIKDNNWYTSKLESGILERKFHFNDDLSLFTTFKEFQISQFNLNNDLFLIENGILKKVKIQNKDVVIPEGVVALNIGLFWDDQIIENVNLPKSLINLGGDTFYNCKNLKYINIPEKVEIIGDNPFAGCPKLTINNLSNNFVYENNILYDRNKTKLIYANIQNISKCIKIHEGVKIIKKHAFYLCNNLEKIELPKSLIIIENNPFSGCENIKTLINKSKHFFVYNDKIIYDSKKETILAVLNSINVENLKLLGTTKSIARNSFWNCKNIKNIYIGKNVNNIGYNPFAGCENIIIHVDEKNKNFKSIDGVLYNKDCTRIICYPSNKAIGDVTILDSVLSLERKAFFGANLLNSINLKNVNFISKSCFSCCNNLKEVVLSDMVSYIGKWALSNCEKLDSVSISSLTEINGDIIQNSNHASIKIRNEINNTLIESDNLYSLKSLSDNFSNKIDLIIIDPPYNSKIDYIEYKDDYKNKYCDFINQRISNSIPLLTEQGFLTIFIDEDNLKDILKVCRKHWDKKDVLIKKWEKVHPIFDKNKEVTPNKKYVKYEYIVICKNKNSKFNDIEQPFFENDKLVTKLVKFPDEFSLFGTNWSAKEEIKRDFDNKLVFTTPKPIYLLKELIRGMTKDKSIILDYFAGSGTTGIATMQLNDECKSNRKVILVTNNENDIFNNVTKPRIKKYMTKYDSRWIII